MDFQSIFEGVVSSSIVIGLSVFIFKESFIKLLTRGIERHKQLLGIEAKQRELALKAQIEFKEKQLSEFYGPIYALLKRGRTKIYPYWMDKKLEGISKQLMAGSVKANKKIEEIILNNSHLIEGAEIPDSYINYLTHVTIWHYYLETDHKGVPFSKKTMPEAFYPEEFEKDIFGTTERLKSELFGLHKESGLFKVTIQGVEPTSNTLDFLV